VDTCEIDILPRTTRSNSADVSMTAAGTAESNPYVNGLPGEIQQKLAKRCAELFEVYVDHHASMGRVTL
jgi:endo-1,4-beta-xylanase